MLFSEVQGGGGGLALLGSWKVDFLVPREPRNS